MNTINPTIIALYQAAGVEAVLDIIYDEKIRDSKDPIMMAHRAAAFYYMDLYNTCEAINGEDDDLDNPDLEYRRR